MSKGDPEVVSVTIHKRHFKAVDFSTINRYPYSFWDRVNRGDWEQAVFNVFDRYLDKDHSYIDIGAWIGPTVLYGSQIAQHCYALEPDPIALEEFQANLSANPQLIPKVTICPYALSSTTGEISLFSKKGFGESISSLIKEPESIRETNVPAIHWNAFLEKHHVTNCNFIKMDIEGGELFALPPMIEYLSRKKPTLYISLHPHRIAKTDHAPLVHALEKIFALYKHTYLSNGSVITFVQCLDRFDGGAFDVVLSEDEW